MIVGSVCSGIGAPEVAWSSLGWRPQWFSEIATFPSKVLAHHFPQVPNHGSLLGLSARNVCSPVDVIVGGTPCQSFSVAGLRGGLADERGNLALEFARLVGAVRPRWFVWENVPGVLSSGGGRDFGSILGALAELGYGLAWRVLDARYFGVPQRRRRVFVVGYLGAAAAAGAVLFEPESVSWNFETRGKTWEDFAAAAPKRPDGGRDVNRAAPTLDASYGRLWGCDNQHIDSGAGLFVPDVSHTLNAGGVSRLSTTADTYVCTAEGSESFGLTKSNVMPGTNNQSPLVASFDPAQVTLKTNHSSGDPRTAAIAKSARPPHVELAFNARQDPISGPISGPIDTDGSTQAALVDWRIRRLTPTECERLQGFPDNYTAIPGAKDSPRYAALGNSMAVPVLRWIGQRIELVDNILKAE